MPSPERRLPECTRPPLAELHKQWSRLLATLCTQARSSRATRRSWLNDLLLRSSTGSVEILQIELPFAAAHGSPVAKEQEARYVARDFGTVLWLGIFAAQP